MKIPKPNPEGSKTNSHLIFRLHESLFAVNAGVVREIFRLPELTPIAESMQYIEGVVNLRGGIVPVMNLDMRLGQESERYRISDNVIVLEQENRDSLLGIIVSEAMDVRLIQSENIEASSLERSGHYHVISYHAKLDDDIIMLLDHDKLLVENPADTSFEKTPTPQKKEKQIWKKHHVFCPEATQEERETFRERAQSLRVSIESQDLSDLTPLSVVGLNQEYFGIDLDLVCEFADMQDVTPIPCCPRHIIGNMNLRGDILTLIDVRGILNMPMTDVQHQGKVIVVQTTDNEEILRVGILVDQVFDVIYARSKDIDTIPAAIKSISEKYLKGTVPYEDKILTVIDLKNILTKGELVVDETI
ncbi:MAG: hypothetical protein B6244_07850 [Candidatus Cloacimonetes bacterium 4572_55]|nr:MAG: hypothetical protein B6244_07850 [Candidatus Cloacimonetes bacterium 4572_55]